MSTENEALVRRFFEDFCTGREANLAHELISPDYVSHGPQAPPAEGPQGVIERVGLYQDSVDGHWEIDEIRPAIAWSRAGPVAARTSAS